MLRKLKGTNIFKYIIRLWSINGRLHKEALKQAATDPKTGIIDVGILTTGVSTSERQRRELLAKELRKVLQSKSRGGAPLKQAEIFEAMKEQSQAVRGVERVYYINNNILFFDRSLHSSCLKLLWNYCKMKTFAPFLLAPSDYPNER